MAETELTSAEATALDGTTDSDCDFKYHSPGDAEYYTEGQRQRQRLLAMSKALGNAFRVYKDGALTYGIRAGKVENGSSTLTYAGSTSNALTDDSANYIYLYILSGSLTLGISTSDFPDPATTPHLPLASITAASGAYAYDDIVDLRMLSAYALNSGATAADLNTLTDASNADALHVHAVAGLQDAVQDVIPYLTVVGTDDGDGTGYATIQAKDLAGNDLAQRFVVHTWVNASAAYATSAALTDYSVTTGTELQEILADAEYTVISDTNGTVVMNIEESGTVYIHAQVNGRIYAGSIAITGP